jgi:uncharacterized alkaline shock family protein YloU
MKGKMNTEMGDILIDKAVLAKYAGTATMECFGVVGMASVNVKDGMTKLLKREDAGRGVNVSITDNRLKIHLHVIIAYGVSIKAVSRTILENVRCRMEAYTGMDVSEMSVIVEGVRVVDD